MKTEKSGPASNPIERFYDDRASGYGEMVSKAEYNIPKWVENHASSITGHRVLDLGCGNGNLGAALISKRQEFELYGADLSQKMVQEAQSRGIYRGCIQHDLSRGMPEFPDAGAYDLVMALGFMEFFERPEKLLEKMRARLNPKGRIWFSLEKTKPESEASGDIRPALGFAMYHFSKDETLEIAQRAGLSILSIVEFGSYLRSYDQQRVPWWLVEAEAADCV